MSTSKQSGKTWALPESFTALFTSPLEPTLTSLLPPRTPIPTPTPPLINPAGASGSGSNDFMAALWNTPDAVTNKGGAGFSTTGSAITDLMFSFDVGAADPSELRGMLDRAWIENAEAAVKAILHQRSIHEGKGDRVCWRVAMGWLLEKAPHVMLANLHLLVDPLCPRPRSKKRDAQGAAKKAAAADADLGVMDLDEEEELEYPARPHGSFDDLVELLVYRLDGQLDGSYENLTRSVEETCAPSSLAKVFGADREAKAKASEGGEKHLRDRSGFKRLGKVAQGYDKDSFHWKILRAGTPKAKHDLFQARLERALVVDKVFTALYLQVLDIFVTYLRADLDLLAKHAAFLKLPSSERGRYKGDASPHLFGMSFAGKWAPTPAHGIDRQTFFASALAIKLFPSVEVGRARQRLQKEVLSPLRKALSVPEVAMVHGPWKIDYTKVPARAMARNVANFMVHDPEGYDAYLTKVAEGRSTISGASLFPHEMLMDVVNPKHPAFARVANLQWDVMVDAVASSSSSQFSNCIAIADVSGSMGSFGYNKNKAQPQPIDVCIALTLLLGQLSEAPWRGAFFTFSSNPSYQFVDPSLPLEERAGRLHQADWGMETNFWKVFDLILSIAVRDGLARDKMVKKLFVFSDMQFDEAGGEDVDHMSEHAKIKRKFVEAGYDMPELVYWNLVGGEDVVDAAPAPARGDETGISLVSGWSGALMKYFLGQQAEEEDEEMAEEMDKEWEKEMEEGEKEKEEAERPKKKGKTPNEEALKMVSKDVFKGVVVA